MNRIAHLVISGEMPVSRLISLVNLTRIKGGRLAAGSAPERLDLPILTNKLKGIRHQFFRIDRLDRL